jgi:hypothetical protein
LNAAAARQPQDSQIQGLDWEGMLQRGRQPPIAGGLTGTPVNASTHGTPYSPHPSHTIKTSPRPALAASMPLHRRLDARSGADHHYSSLAGADLSPTKRETHAPMSAMRLILITNHERQQLRTTTLALNHGRPSHRDASPHGHLPPRQLNSQPRRANSSQAQSIDHFRHKVTWCARLRKLRGKPASIHRMPSCGQLLRTGARP